MRDIIIEKVVPIADVLLESDLQMRVTMPERTIAEYAEAMLNGSSFPALMCAQVDGTGPLLCYDGWLRKQAANRNGVAEIKVHVRKAESRDQIVLWAVEANAHEGLRRTNADKQHSVMQLIATDLGKSMTAVEISRIAGVHISMVTRYREHQVKTDASICQANSETSPKVKTSRGLRPKTYNTKKKRAHQPKPFVRPEIKAMQWPTRDETGRPPPEIENEPHPDHPGLTRAQVFNQQHGFVQLFPSTEKRRQDHAIATREILGKLRDIGTICRELVPLTTKITPEEVLTALDGLEAQKWKRIVPTYAIDLQTALPFMLALLKAYGARLEKTDDDLANVVSLLPRE